MEVAKTIAEALVTRRHAACVNIVPGVESVYMWKGKLEQDKEHMLMIKAPTVRVGDIITTVKELHPYEVPEVISVPMGQGSPQYLDFVRHNTLGGAPTPAAAVPEAPKP
jgi:periplasmic divalent cation tolerance protein